MDIHNILHITPSYKPAYIYGGPTRSVSELCENQALIGCIVTVYTTNANGSSNLPSGKENINGVTIYYFKRITGDHTHFSPALLWNVWLNCTKFDIVHIHSWWNLVAVFSLIICRLRGVQAVFSPRGMLGHYSMKSKSKRIFHRFLGEKLLKNTFLHASSDKEAQEALLLIPDWKYFILPNILNLPIHPELYNNGVQNADVFNLIFLARIHPIKGLDVLFEALTLVDFPWRLSIVGDGDTEYVDELKTFAIVKGISEKIDWLGWKNNEEKFHLLGKSDLFVLPSNYESFSNVVIESLSVGTPVLISIQVGLHSYVRKQEFGWIYLDTSEALSIQLIKAYHDESKRAKIRMDAPTKILTDFGAESLTRQYLTAYNEMFS